MIDVVAPFGEHELLIDSHVDSLRCSIEQQFPVVERVDVFDSNAPFNAAARPGMKLREQLVTSPSHLYRQPQTRPIGRLSRDFHSDRPGWHQGFHRDSQSPAIGETFTSGTVTLVGGELVADRGRR